MGVLDKFRNAVFGSDKEVAGRDATHVCENEFPPANTLTIFDIDPELKQVFGVEDTVVSMHAYLITSEMVPMLASGLCITQNLIQEAKAYARAFPKTNLENGTFESFFSGPTKTGKVPKFPLQIHFDFDYGQKLVRGQLMPDTFFGNLYFDKTGSLGKAELIRCENTISYEIRASYSKGNLSVQRIDYSSEKTGYLKENIYVRSK